MNKKQKPTIREWLKKNRDKYPITYMGWKNWIADCMKALNVNRRSVRRVSKDIWKCPANYSETSNPNGLDRDQFKKQHDEYAKAYEAIKDAVENLIKHKDENDDRIIDEIQFRSQWCSISNTTIFRQIANQPEFRQYQFRIKKKIFWTTPRTKEWALKEVTQARDL